MKIVREALAGTLESSDLMVKIAPTDGELEVVVRSEVNETLRAMEIRQGLIIIEDKGALDCVICARLQSAVLRAAEEKEIAWGTLL